MPRNVPPAKGKSVRLPILYWQRLDELAEKFELSQSAALVVAIDRMYQQEFGVPAPASTIGEISQRDGWGD